MVGSAIQFQIVGCFTNDIYVFDFLHITKSNIVIVFRNTLGNELDINQELGELKVCFRIPTIQ